MSSMDLPGAKMLLSARAASKTLSICERSLWGVTKRGEIPCIRIGRRVLYDPRDLRAWIDSKKEEGQR